MKIVIYLISIIVAISVLLLIQVFLFPISARELQRRVEAANPISMVEYHGVLVYITKYGEQDFVYVFKQSLWQINRFREHRRFGLQGYFVTALDRYLIALVFEIDGTDISLTAHEHTAWERFTRIFNTSLLIIGISGLMYTSICKAFLKEWE